MVEKERMRIAEGIQDLWDALTMSQKRVLMLLVVFVLVVTLSGWWNSIRLNHQVNQYENEAVKAKIKASDALKKAAEIADTIRNREEEIREIEVKRDAEIEKLESAGRDTANARADYDRALRERREDISSNDLCLELAELGYSCR